MELRLSRSWLSGAHALWQGIRPMPYKLQWRLIVLRPWHNCPIKLPSKLCVVCCCQAWSSETRPSSSLNSLSLFHYLFGLVLDRGWKCQLADTVHISFGSPPVQFSALLLPPLSSVLEVNTCAWTFAAPVCRLQGPLAWEGTYLVHRLQCSLGPGVVLSMQRMKLLKWMQSWHWQHNLDQLAISLHTALTCITKTNRKLINQVQSIMSLKTWQILILENMEKSLTNSWSALLLWVFFYYYF
jgi:hypothetical protein